METEKTDIPRKMLAAHLPFGGFFMFSGDLTIFQLTEKDFLKRVAKAHVFHHTHLKTSVPFDEIVHPLGTEDVAVIALLLARYNGSV